MPTPSAQEEALFTLALPNQPLSARRGSWEEIAAAEAKEKTEIKQP